MWQTIDSAPKDETDIILYYPPSTKLLDIFPCMVFARWSKNCGGWWVFTQRAAFDYSSEYQPSYWMPRPRPPLTDEAKHPGAGWEISEQTHREIAAIEENIRSAPHRVRNFLAD